MVRHSSVTCCVKLSSLVQTDYENERTWRHNSQQRSRLEHTSFFVNFGYCWTLTGISWCKSFRNKGHRHTYKKEKLQFVGSLLNQNFIIAGCCWRCWCQWVRLSLRCGHQRACCQPPRCYISLGPRWDNIDRGKLKNTGKNMSQCQFVHHKYHTHWSGCEPGSPQREWLG
jgi:hypothetical protein